MIHSHLQQQSGNQSQAFLAKASSFLESLSKEERAAIKETDEEMKRRGFFKRIFPCLDFLYYRQFFEEERIVNYVIDAKLYARKRNINPVQLRKIQPMPLFLMREQMTNQDAVANPNPNNIKNLI